jgi:hypothetical protein
MTRGDSPRRSRRSVQADSDKQTRRVVTDSARADGVKIGPGREHQARVKGSIWDGRARVRAAHAAQGPWGVDVVGEGGATRDTAGRRGVFSQPPAAEIFNDNTSSAVRNMDPTCPGYTESVKGLRTAKVRMTWGTDMCDLPHFCQGQHSMVQTSTNNGALGIVVASNRKNIIMYSNPEEFDGNLDRPAALDILSLPRRFSARQFEIS